MPMTRLARAELLLFVLLIAHTVDHAVNQPSRELPSGSGVVGLLGFAIVAVALIAELRSSRLRAPIGVAAGGLTVLGFLAVHVIGFGPVSDPYRDFDPNALSWALLLAPLAAALAVTAIAAGDIGRARTPATT
jgi:hypothetical protein